MNARRVAIAACMLCALAISAIAAQSAAAATNGTTVFTCKETGPGGGFTKAHCKPSDAGSGNFSHVAVAENTTTDITVTSAKTNAETNGPTKSVLKATVAGVGVELSSTEVHGEGGLINRKDPSGEHFVEIHELTLTYTGVTANLEKCEVFTDSAAGTGVKGVIHTEPLVGTSTEQGDSIKFTPKEGEVFARFELVGPECPVANTYTVLGSITCKPDGATINCNHNEVTEKGTLRLQSKVGPKAGYAGSVTVSGKDTVPPDLNYTPLSVTTVSTP